jgi:hypothetical protein
MGKDWAWGVIFLILLTMKSIAVMDQINVLQNFPIISYLCNRFQELYFWSQDISFDKSLTLKKLSVFQAIAPPEAIRIWDKNIWVLWFCH